MPSSDADDLPPFAGGLELTRSAIAFAAAHHGRRAFAARAHVSLTDPALGRRLSHYRESHRMLEATGTRSPLIDQLGFELWALRRLPPG